MACGGPPINRTKIVAAVNNSVVALEVDEICPEYLDLAGLSWAWVLSLFLFVTFIDRIYGHTFQPSPVVRSCRYWSKEQGHKSK